MEVICDEIESYNDSPAELIYDDFENIIFEGHPLGHNILGNAKQLRTYTTEDALRFVRRNYRTDNTIFFAYGEIDFKRLVKLMSKVEIEKTEKIQEVKFAETKVPQSHKPLVIERQLNTHQAHVMLGTRAYDNSTLPP